MSRNRPGQWHKRIGDVATFVSEPCEARKKSVTNKREKDISMNTSSETWQLGDQEVQVSHLEKVYWRQTGFTKGDLLGYYRQIAPF